MTMEYLGGWETLARMNEWDSSGCRLGKGKGSTYVVEHLVHGEEAGEETARVGHAHFVGDTGRVVSCADDAVVPRVE
jgi:hypothetical protein